VRTRVNFSRLLSALGRNPEAEEQLRAALAAEPDLPEARYNLGLLLAGMGRLDEAGKALDAWSASHPEDPRIPAVRSTLDGRSSGKGEPSPGPDPG
jgi:predicted Zn-dependent protease